MRSISELEEQWQWLLWKLTDDPLDLGEIKNLIFDTYHFLKKELKGDTVPREFLVLYKNISKVCCLLYLDYPSGIKVSEALAFYEFAWSLCYVFESGFEECSNNPLEEDSLSSTVINNSKVDMTTYESFEKGFNQVIRKYTSEDY